MENYMLWFCVYDAYRETVVPYLRIVAADTKEEARRIGSAMVGELIAPERRLDSFVHAIPTALLPSIPETLRSNRSLWLRVLHLLGLHERQVRWVYSYRIQETEIVGFFLWPRAE